MFQTIECTMLKEVTVATKQLSVAESDMTSEHEDDNDEDIQTWSSCWRGILLGSLICGIVLAVILTVWLTSPIKSLCFTILSKNFC